MDLVRKFSFDANELNNASEKEKDDEDTELSPLQSINKTTERNETSEEPQPTSKLTWRQRLKLIKDNTTVEPILACYIMPSVLASLATQNLNLEKACRVNLNYSAEICDALSRRDLANYTEHEQNVQTLLAGIIAWKNVVQTTIPCLLILFVGAWSDKTGKRKACILIPIFGEFLTAIGFIVNTYFFYELPAEVAAMTEAIFPALTGGWFTNFIGVYSYIGDITSKEKRTYRVGVANMCSQLGIPIGSALSGVLLRWIGYYGVFSISALLYLCSIMYGYFYLEEPKRKEPYISPHSGIFGFFKEFFDTKLITETFKVALKNGPGNRRLRVLLLIIVVCVIFGPSQGEYTILYLFTRVRFNWDEVQFSLWSTYGIITNLLGTLFSLTLFSKYMKLGDPILGIISNTSKIIAAFGYAFARTDLQIYLATLLEILSGTSFIALRSIASKLVSGDEFGKVNSLFGLVEAMMPLLYGPLYTSVYSATLNVMPGAVFLLGAILTLPSIAIFGWIHYENKKEIKRNKTVKDEKENSKNNI